MAQTERVLRERGGQQLGSSNRGVCHGAKRWMVAPLRGAAPTPALPARHLLQVVVRGARGLVRPVGLVGYGGAVRFQGSLLIVPEEGLDHHRLRSKGQCEFVPAGPSASPRGLSPLPPAPLLPGCGPAAGPHPGAPQAPPRLPDLRQGLATWSFWKRGWRRAEGPEVCERWATRTVGTEHGVGTSSAGPRAAALGCRRAGDMTQDEQWALAWRSARGPVSSDSCSLCFQSIVLGRLE